MLILQITQYQVQCLHACLRDEQLNAYMLAQHAKYINTRHNTGHYAASVAWPVTLLLHYCLLLSTTVYYCLLLSTAVYYKVSCSSPLISQGSVKDTIGHDFHYQVTGYMQMQQHEHEAEH